MDETKLDAGEGVKLLLFTLELYGRTSNVVAV